MFLILKLFVVQSLMKAVDDGKSLTAIVGIIAAHEEKKTASAKTNAEEDAKFYNEIDEVCCFAFIFEINLKYFPWDRMVTMHSC